MIRITQLLAIADEGKKQLEEFKNINLGTKLLKTISFFSTISEKAKKINE